MLVQLDHGREITAQSSFLYRDVGSEQLQTGHHSADSWTTQVGGKSSKMSTPVDLLYSEDHSI